MTTCSGKGDNGDHCCYINGAVCPLLAMVDGVPRCTVWDDRMRGNAVWEQSPVGQWMAERYPGKDCHDWPQNIPEVMEAGRGLCCWQGDA